MDDLCLADVWEWKPKAGGDHFAARDSNCAPRLLSFLGCAAERRAHPARCQTEPWGCTVSHGQLQKKWACVSPVPKLTHNNNAIEMTVWFILISWPHEDTQNPSIHPSIHPLYISWFIHASIYPFINPSIYFTIHPSIHQSIYRLIFHPSIGLHSATFISIRAFIDHPLFINSSTHPSIYALIHSSHPFIHPSIYLFIHPTIGPSIQLSISPSMHSLIILHSSTHPPTRLFIH